MKRAVILAFAAACGSSSPAPVAPAATGSAVAPPTAVVCTPPAQPGLLGITDILIKDGGSDAMAVKPNGDVQINDGSWKTIGKLDRERQDRRRQRQRENGRDHVRERRLDEAHGPAHPRPDLVGSGDRDAAGGYGDAGRDDAEPRTEEVTHARTRSSRTGSVTAPAPSTTP
jgi:hypothetical protein